MFASRRRNAIIEYYDKYNYDYWKAVSSHEDGQLMLHESDVLEYDNGLGNLVTLKMQDVALVKAHNGMTNGLIQCLKDSTTLPM